MPTSEPPSLVDHFQLSPTKVEPAYPIENLPYFSWTADLRQKFFDALVAGGKEDDLIIPIKTVEFLSVRPLHEGDEVSSSCHVTRIGTKAFDLTYELRNKRRDELCASGKSVHVAVDKRTGKSREIPKDLVEFMRQPSLFIQPKFDDEKEAPLMRGTLLSEKDSFPEIPPDGFQIVGRKDVEPFNIDLFRHVNNRFPIFWSAAMSKRFYDEVISAHTNAQRDVIVKEVKITYELPLLEFHGPEEQRKREVALVGCRAASIDKDSVGLAIEVWSASNQKRCAHGTLFLEAYDPLSRERTNIPEDWSSIIRARTRVIPITDTSFITLGSDKPGENVEKHLKDAYTGFLDTARHLNILLKDHGNDEVLQTKIIQSAHTHLRTVAEHDSELDPQSRSAVQRALVHLERVSIQDPVVDRKTNPTITETVHTVELIVPIIRDRLNLPTDEIPARNLSQIRKSS